MLLGLIYIYLNKKLLDFHHLWFSIQLIHFLFIVNIFLINPQPQFKKIGLGCSRFAHRYLGNRFCFFFVWLLRCFSSPACVVLIL